MQPPGLTDRLMERLAVPSHPGFRSRHPSGVATLEAGDGSHRQGFGIGGYMMERRVGSCLAHACDSVPRSVVERHQGTTWVMGVCASSTGNRSRNPR